MLAIHRYPLPPCPPAAAATPILRMKEPMLEGIKAAILCM